MLELQTANKNKRTKNGGGDGITALYCRLSVDDNGTEGESNSIKNQRDILGRYAKQHGYRNIEYYIDDGYSGTNFNRPDFQRMMSDVDEGKVKTIIVKDMSRLGRDYLKVGYKDDEFHDPAITELWIEIINDINNSSFNQVLSKYIDKNKIEQYCSQATTAILAIPTVRIRSVVNDIKNERIEVLSDEQKTG